MKKNGYLDKQNISNPNKRINPKNKTKRKKSNINKILPNKINNLITNNETKKSTNLHNTNIHLNLNHKKNNKNNDDDKEENYFGIIRINLNNIKEYYPKDSNQTLHNYTFEEAIKYDKRNIFRICYIYLLSKQIIFRTFLFRCPLDLFPLRFILFIFMLSCDLALNALFYFNDNISKKYQFSKNLFLFTFSNNISIIAYSTLVSSFVMSLFSKLSNSSNAIRNVFRKEEEKIKRSKRCVINKKKNGEILSEIKNILKCYRIKNIFLISIELILLLFFWYFVTAFCHVYSSTQLSWLLDSFFSILSRLILEFIFSFIFAKL